MSPIADGGGSAKRSAALVLGAALASVLLVTTAVIASTYTAQRVASNARALHWANGALGSAALARASVGQAVFFGVDEELGVASAEAVESAIGAARADLAALTLIADGSIDGIYIAPSELSGSIAEQLETGAATLDLLEAGDSAAAVDLKAGSLDPAFTELAVRLAAQQQTVAASIAATETLAGRIDTITRIGVMLALPALAFTIYWRRAKRTMRAAKRRHEAELEIERRSASAKDEFFAAVSHELRTPLTTILGFSEVLLDGSARPEEQGEMVGLIQQDAIDLERRIDDLVATARSAAKGMLIEVGSFGIEPVLQEVAGTVPTEKDVYVDGEQAVVVADPSAVRQILRNLLSNAARHGGSTIWIWGRTESDRYLVSVCDDGDGFDPSILDSIEGPFAHDHREAIINGTMGLGLSAAAALAEATGAELGYRRLSGWTQVGLFLSLAASETKSGAQGPTQLEAMSA